MSVLALKPQDLTSINECHNPAPQPLQRQAYINLHGCPTKAIYFTTSYNDPNQSLHSLYCAINLAFGIPFQKLEEDAILVCNGIYPHQKELYESQFIQQCKESDINYIYSSSTDCYYGSQYYNVPLSITLLFRIRGGKGGFGSLLKKLTGGGKKTTNTDAMRDLHGRRLRHAKTVERFQAWMQKKKDEEEIIELLNDGELPIIDVHKKREITLDDGYFERLARAGESRLGMIEQAKIEKEQEDVKRREKERKMDGRGIVYNMIGNEQKGGSSSSRPNSTYDNSDTDGVNTESDNSATAAKRRKIHGVNDNDIDLNPNSISKYVPGGTYTTKKGSTTKVKDELERAFARFMAEKGRDTSLNDDTNDEDTLSDLDSISSDSDEELNLENIIIDNWRERGGGIKSQDITGISKGVISKGVTKQGQPKKLTDVTVNDENQIDFLKKEAAQSVSILDFAARVEDGLKVTNKSDHSLTYSKMQTQNNQQQNNLNANGNYQNQSESFNKDSMVDSPKDLAPKPKISFDLDPSLVINLEDDHFQPYLSKKIPLSELTPESLVSRYSGDQLKHTCLDLKLKCGGLPIERAKRIVEYVGKKVKERETEEERKSKKEKKKREEK